MTPILYSFRRCPYAMRARLAIQTAGIQVELREVVLKNKPAELLQVSPKATVPVLVLRGGQVINESRDIMLWALQQNDPQHWLGESAELLEPSNALIDANDAEFKANLDGYKYADRYPESADYYRQQGEVFLQKLEERLGRHRYLLSDQVSLADMAIFPFIRQFAHVDKIWFDQTAYQGVQQWLSHFLASASFNNAMFKYPPWQSGDEAVYFS